MAVFHSAGFVDPYQQPRSGSNQLSCIQQSRIRLKIHLTVQNAGTHARIQYPSNKHARVAAAAMQTRAQMQRGQGGVARHARAY